MKRETFVAILGAALAEADAELLREAENLVFGRKRSLREDEVRKYTPGEYVLFTSSDGKSQLRGRVHHLNKFSLTLEYFASSAYDAKAQREVVPVERVLGRHLTGAL
jgi:hypothetical protein